MTTPQEGCTFCENIPNPTSAFDASQLLYEDSTTVIKPALGMLLPGYLLAVTGEHNTSFAQLDESELKNIDTTLTVVESELSGLFGRYFRCESGSDNIAEYGGSGACVDHAHQHLVPAEDVGKKMLESLAWQQLDDYEEIAGYRDKPYIYLGIGGSHYIIAEPHLPGQYMRRQLAEIRNLSAPWDWAVWSGWDNLHKTLSELRATRLGALAIAAWDLMPAVLPRE